MNIKMRDNVDNQEFVTLIKQKVKAVYLIILFGSHAKGVAREESDIDIAYLSDVKLSSYDIFMVAQELAGMVGCEVDLLDLDAASTVMKAQVLSEGQIIYCSDDVKRMYFYMRAFKEYALLNEERFVILENIKRRGSIYG